VIVHWLRARWSLENTTGDGFNEAFDAFGSNKSFAG
jgi:hypothetical protein